jgi:hypothetical protein
MGREAQLGLQQYQAISLLACGVLDSAGGHASDQGGGNGGVRGRGEQGVFECEGAV